MRGRKIPQSKDTKKRELPQKQIAIQIKPCEHPVRMPKRIGIKSRF